jgi:hypothetical protein
MIWIWVASLLPSLSSLLALIGIGSGTAASFSLPTLPTLPTLATIKASFAGFTPAVWGVVMLKALNGILIPATFKYADNILYTYAKPGSIILMTLVSCISARAMPEASLVLGVGAVVGSIFLYSSKPKPKAD